MVEPGELEIVVLVDPPEICGDPVLEVISGAGVAPACVGPASGNAGSFVRIRMCRTSRCRAGQRGRSRRRRAIPLKTKLATNAPFSVTLIVGP